MVLFSDATSHPTLHPDTVAAGAVGADASAVGQALVEKGCSLHAWAPHCPVWDALTSVPRVKFNSLDHAGDGFSSVDFTQLMLDLRKTVSQTASQSLGGAAATVPFG